MKMLSWHRHPYTRHAFHICSPSFYFAASLTTILRNAIKSTPSRKFLATIPSSRARSSVLIESRNRFSILIEPRQSRSSQATIAIPDTAVASTEILDRSRSHITKPLSIIRASRKQTSDPWTRQEDELLFNLRQQGTPWKKISPILKRHVGSCYSRYYRFLDPFLADAIEDDADEEELISEAVDASQRTLEANVKQSILKRSREKSGLPLPYSVQGPWTAKDREKLEALITSKTPWPVIARDLQRNQASCKEKWHRIQKHRFEMKHKLKRERSELWKRLFKEGFMPHHREQLVHAIEKQLSSKQPQVPHLNNPLGLFDVEGRQADDGAFAMMMMHQTHNFTDDRISEDGDNGIYSGKSDDRMIDWDAVALAFNNKFSALHLKSIYRDLAASKLIWTPEEDDRLIRVVVRLGPPEFQPNLWTMIKDAFGDAVRTSEEYEARWRVLDMPLLEREWDDSEKTKFWRRWMELQSNDSIFSHPSFSGAKSRPDLEKDPIEPDLQCPIPANKECMWDTIAEGLEYRHGRDCQIYFERTTAHFPKDPKLFRYLTQEVANVYVRPRRIYWSSEATRKLVTTVNTSQQSKNVISWSNIARSLGNKFTANQCEWRWAYWSQRQHELEPANQSPGLENSVSISLDSSEVLPGKAGISSEACTSNPRLWSDHELELLRKGVQECGHNWTAIREAFLPHRTIQMLSERFWRDQAKKTGRFSEQERNLLEIAIETFGEDAGWGLIASQVPGRTASQCRKHWSYARTHHIQKLGEPWTKQDRERLKKAVDKFGTKWSLISEFVVGKTPDQCRNEWRQKLNPNIKIGPWSGKELDRLMERVETIMSRKEEEENIKVAEALRKAKEGGALDDVNLKELTPRYKGKRKVDWEEVARGMDGRTLEQCRIRFTVHRNLYKIQGDY
ncbi:Myb-like DNA-binding domain protein [Mortierella sp. AM989]|nr:Myb-like DNA-binding domain protein [Mortierella sp. AM989]